MVNAWSLAYETLYGDMDKTYPIKKTMKLRPKTMKISDKTLTLLKNFSNINQSILFKQGKELRTISVMKNILAEATIEEDVPKDFGIYDLNQFLNGLALHQKRAGLDFENESYVVIKEGRMRSKYFFADPKVIVTPPEKEITLPSEDVAFTVSTDQLEKLLKKTLQYINFQICLLLVVMVLLNFLFVIRRMIHQMISQLLLVRQMQHSLNFKVENIKILPGTYDVVMSKKLLSRFVSKDYNLKYYIALEPDSTFE